jgi:hypothetical protein
LLRQQNADFRQSKLSPGTAGAFFSFRSPTFQ